MKDTVFYPALTALILLFSGISWAQTLDPHIVQLADSADRYIAREKWEEAESVIVKALRLNPAEKSNWLLWNNLGIVHTKQGFNARAIEDFSIGLASAPKSTVLLVNRAAALLENGSKTDALADLDEALKVDSLLQWPRKMRGVLLAETGCPEEAEADFSFYESLWGEDSAIWESRGDIAASTGDVKKAYDFYFQAAQSLEDEDMAVKLFLYLAKYGAPEEHLDLLTQAIAQWPRNPSLYFARAIAAKNRYQTESMENDLKTAVSLGADKELLKILDDN